MADGVVLDRAIVELVAETEGFRRDIARASQEFQRHGQNLQRIGTSLSLNLTAPLVAIGGAAFKAAADFETAMTGVAKTVDAPADAIAGLGERFRELSEEIPVSTNELAKLAELGGQLGIEFGNLESFVETMAALGVSTNLSAEQAATSLARLANITGTAQDEFDRLGSVIVALGNNLATTEQEIVSMGLRIAAAGEQVGLTEADILGLAGALSSVGVEADVGGTAISQTMIQMAAAVQEGGDALKVFAETAGTTANEFINLYERDASEAVLRFVEGLGRINEEGGNVFPILEDLQLGGIRATRALLSVAAGSGKLRDALELGSRAWEENSALTQEAGRFYDRMAARFDELKNQAVNVAAEFGQALASGFEAMLRAGRDVLDVVRGLTNAFEAMPVGVRKATVEIAALVAVLGPAVIALSALSKIMGVVLGLSVVGTFTQWAGAVAFFAAQAGSLGGAIGVVLGLLNPWVLAIGLAGAALVGTAQSSGKLRRELEQTAKGLKDATDAMDGFGKAATRASLENFTAALSNAQAEVERIKQAIAEEPQGGLLGGSPQLQADLVEAQRRVRELEVLVEGAAKRWVEFGDGAADAVRTVQELAAEIARIGIGGFDASELRDLVRVQNELRQIVEDTAATDEDRIRATQLLAQVTAEINRLRAAGGKDLQEEIDLLAEAVDLGVAHTNEVQRLRTIQASLNQIIEAGTGSLLERIEAARQELQIRQAIEAAEEQNRRTQRIQAELDIQQAVLAGNEELAQQLKDNREVVDALAEGYTDAQVEQLKHIQALRAEERAQKEAADAAEKAARETAEAARQMADLANFRAQLGAAEARAAGDETGARRILGEAAIQSQIEAYQELVDAGLITEDQVQRLAAALRADLVASLEEASSALGIASAVVGGLISVADALDALGPAGQQAARGISDILAGAKAIQEFGAGSVAGSGGIGSIIGGFVGVLSGILGDAKREAAEQQRLREAVNRTTESLEAFADSLREVSRFTELSEKALRELGDAFAAATARLTQDPERFLAGFEDIKDQILEMALAGASLDEILRFVTKNTILTTLSWEELIPALEAFVEAAKRVEEARQREIRSMEDDLRIRLLVAQGRSEEADALRQEIADRALLAEALALGGEELQAWVQAMLDAIHAAEEATAAQEELKRAQEEAAEAARKAAQMVRDAWSFRADLARMSGDPALAARLETSVQADLAISAAEELLRAGVITTEEFKRYVELWQDAVDEAGVAVERQLRREAARRSSDLISRELALGGDDLGAFIEQRNAQARDEIAVYEDLFRAGTITREEFERWVAVIRGEAAEAIDDYKERIREAAKAAREAAAAEQLRQAVDKERLRIQILLAQGRDAEAAAAQLQLDIQQALRDGRDGEYIAMLRQLAAIREAERQTRNQARAQEDLARSIAQTTTALNAPAGLRLSLLRWRALLADQIAGPSVNQTAMFARAQTAGTPQALDGRGTGTAGASIVINGDLTAMVQPDEDPQEWLSRIASARDTRIRAGGTDPFDRVSP